VQVATLDAGGRLENRKAMTDVEASFIEAARAYCEWVDSTPREAEDEARLALRLLSRLYHEALLLPRGDCGEDIEGQRISHEVWRQKHRRFSSMPFQYYRAYHKPTDLDDEESVVGDLADDLADIYRDLADGLSLYDGGHVVEALWEFRQSFRNHWGCHTVSAVNALHRHIADSYADL
jgi:hypothetical protein